MDLAVTVPRKGSGRMLRFAEALGDFSAGQPLQICQIINRTMHLPCRERPGGEFPVRCQVTKREVKIELTFCLGLGHNAVGMAFPAVKIPGLMKFIHSWAHANMSWAVPQSEAEIQTRAVTSSSACRTHL